MKTNLNTRMRAERIFRLILLCMFCFVLVDGGGLLLAQNTINPSDITAEGADGDIVSGLTIVLNYVYLFLKFLAIIAAGWGSYKLWEGEYGPGVWSYLAAFALFFAPKIVEAAQSAAS